MKEWGAGGPKDLALGCFIGPGREPVQRGSAWLLLGPALGLGRLLQVGPPSPLLASALGVHPGSLQSLLHPHPRGKDYL